MVERREEAGALVGRRCDHREHRHDESGDDTHERTDENLTPRDRG